MEKRKKSYKFVEAPKSAFQKLHFIPSSEKKQEILICEK